VQRGVLIQKSSSWKQKEKGGYWAGGSRGMLEMVETCSDEVNQFSETNRQQGDCS
jgi:hypothetical protein